MTACRIVLVSRSLRMSGTDAAWVVLARPDDHHLSADTPMWVDAKFLDQPTPLDMHFHKGMEVGIVVSGEREIRFADLALHLHPGDVWLCAMWEPHAFRVLTPGRGVKVIFLPEMLEEKAMPDIAWLSMFAAPPRDRPSSFTPALRDAALAIGQELTREIEELRDGWQTMVRQGLIRLLVVLSRSWRSPVQPSQSSGVDANDLARIMPALALANSDLRRRVEAQEAAASCGLSRSWFHRIFRHTMGLSFGAFRLRARLGFVARQLLTTSRSIEAVAEESGFVDGSHLHRVFVRSYGCTPAQYRRMHVRGREAYASQLAPDLADVPSLGSGGRGPNY